jgi:hypothetical protein
VVVPQTRREDAGRRRRHGGKHRRQATPPSPSPRRNNRSSRELRITVTQTRTWARPLRPVLRSGSEQRRPPSIDCAAAWVVYTAHEQCGSKRRYVTYQSRTVSLTSPAGPRACTGCCLLDLLQTLFSSPASVLNMPAIEPRRIVRKPSAAPRIRMYCASKYLMQTTASKHRFREVFGQ